MLGLLIPAGLVFLWESINGRIDRLDDLSDLPVKLLGELPYRENKIVVCSDKQNDENKAFRNLRTNLESNFEDGMKAVMLTDLQSNSGKGYVAANLAEELNVRYKNFTKEQLEQHQEFKLAAERETGIEEGLSQGIQQGIEQKTIETVKNMLKENFDIELISRICKLSEEEIMKIKDSN